MNAASNKPGRRPIFDRRSIFFSIAVLILFVVQGLFFWFKPATGNSSAGSGWSANLRELGNKLKGVGVTEEALLQYERYLEQNEVPGPVRANISYSMGKIYLELGKYDKALTWFYQVELADPDTDLRSEVGSKIVNCLERLGKFQAAQYALGARSSLEPQAKEKGGAVVARIGRDEITLPELDEAISQLPPWMADQYKDKDKKAEFLKKYVADELLYRKAVKLEYDKNTEITRQLQSILKELVVRKLIEKEVKAKIKIDEEDLKNYYGAHKDQYKEPERAKVSLIKLKTKGDADKSVKELKSGTSFSELAKVKSLDEPTRGRGGQFPGWVTRGRDSLGIGEVPSVSDAIFGLSLGKTSSPIKVGDYYYIFQLDKHDPEKQKTLDEIKPRVEHDYSSVKFQYAYQDLIQTTLKAEDVKLYPEALK